MTELRPTEIGLLGKSYKNADVRNFLRKSWEKVTKNFRENYETLRRSVLKIYLGKS